MRNSTHSRSKPAHAPLSAQSLRCLDLRHAARTGPDRRSPDRDIPCADRLLTPEVFLARLTQAVAEVRDGGVYALYVIHVEHFSGAAARGEDASAVLLRRLAPSVSAKLGSDICAGRLDGGRFSLLKARCPAYRTPLFARRIRTALERDPFAWRGLAFRLGVSVGGTALTGALQARDLMECAVHACDTARAGRRRHPRVGRATRRAPGLTRRTRLARTPH